jgi:hypothetical protein
VISLFRKFLENRLSIWIVLLFGLVLIFYLYDLTLQTDPYSWLRTAENLFGSGETGTQHRNILFSYLLSIPYFLNINPVYFGCLLERGGGAEAALPTYQQMPISASGAAGEAELFHSGLEPRPFHAEAGRGAGGLPVTPWASLNARRLCSRSAALK